jgi:hypothetical protein
VARSVWACTDPGTGIRYVRQLATASEWGEVITYVQKTDDPPRELSRRCEYGWSTLKPPRAELATVLAAKPKARIRACLTILQEIVTNAGDARYIGLDDGTR